MNRKWNLILSIAQGLLLAILLLEVFGAGLVAVNWWIYREGLLLEAVDKFFAAVLIFFMIIIPVFGVVVLSVLMGVFKFNVIEISLFCFVGYLFLVIISFFSTNFPWTSEILLGKRFDLIIGLLSFFALLVWCLIARRSRLAE